MYDLIIIGMGIGGVTAGIYAKRANLNVLLIDKGPVGGMLNNIEKISNYPGLPSIKGSDFSKELLKQIKELEIPYKNEEVIKIENSSKKTVVTDTGKYIASNIIIATGSKPKYLGLDNEKDLLGRGISTCATCDGAFYKGKEIVVVGGGSSALQESLYLAKICKKIFIVNRKNEFKSEKILIDEVKKMKNIELIFNSTIKKYNELDGKITSIILNTGQEIKTSGVFIYIGYRPASSVANSLEITDEAGYIKVNKNFETSISGIYAIGDVIKKDIYQLVTAASDGIVAVNHICKGKISN